MNQLHYVLQGSRDVSRRREVAIVRLHISPRKLKEFGIEVMVKIF